MRMWDAALLAAKNDDVVRDGLLCWADFRDPVTVTNASGGLNMEGTLTDRATGGLLTIGKTTSWSAVYFTQQNGFLCLQTRDTTSTNKSIFTQTDVTKCKTLEFVYADDTIVDPNGMYWKPMFAGSVGPAYQRDECRVYNNVILNQQPSAFYSELLGTAKPVHICVRIKPTDRVDMFMNGTIKIQDSIAFKLFFPIQNGQVFGVSRKLVTNEQNPTQPLRVGSIRLYNRALTDEEIAQNVQYEISTGRLSL